MTGELVVLLDSVEAGRVFRDARGRARFAYERSYFPPATPISLSMTHGAGDLHHADAWLEGLLPDNADVLQRWAENTGAASTEAYDLLATEIGWECAGAVQFCPPDALDVRRSRGGGVDRLNEADVAGRLRGLEADGTRWHVEGGMFSLSGAQPKIALRHEAGGWGLPWGDEATTHILKPPRSHLDRRVTDSIHINEHLCQSAAAALGIRAATTWLESFENQEVLVVERFDRLDTRRIHTEDLCQALGVRPRHKYEYDGGPGPAAIACLLRDVARPGDDVRFFDALAYNWLIGATDSHAKNFGVVLAGPDATLAPIYDTASWIPYSADPTRARFAMRLGDDYRLVSNSPRRDWTRTARSMGLAPSDALDRIAYLAARLPAGLAEVVSRVPAAFRDRAETVANAILAHAYENHQDLSGGTVHG